MRFSNLSVAAPGCGTVSPWKCIGPELTSISGVLVLFASAATLKVTHA